MQRNAAICVIVRAFFRFLFCSLLTQDRLGFTPDCCQMLSTMQQQLILQGCLRQSDIASSVAMVFSDTKEFLKFHRVVLILKIAYIIGCEYFWL